MEEAFVIDNDVKAEWALRKIRERAAERDRILETSWEIIESYKGVIQTESTRRRRRSPGWRECSCAISRRWNTRRP